MDFKKRGTRENEGSLNVSYRRFAPSGVSCGHRNMYHLIQETRTGVDLHQPRYRGGGGGRDYDSAAAITGMCTT